MNLHILGCYAATPRTLTNPTSQVLEIKNHLFLIDCGEGTQVQLRKHGIKFSRIQHVFISHLHGDHFFGLPGLVSTFRLLGRKTALHIHGPKGIKEAITLLLKLGDSWTDYPLVFHELVSKEREVVFEDGKVRVETIPLDHRVYTNGFLFREMESPSRKLNMEAVKQYNIETYYYQLIKNGKDMVLDDGTVITNQELTLDPPRPKSYAFCSDTAYLPTMVPQIREVDVLYHESTFLESETDKASQTKHTTAREAATIALAAGVGLLILGHYSTRYGSLELFRKEALQVFSNVELAEDGRVFHFH